VQQIARPSIIDVEASGFGPQSYPIEVGVAMASGERYSTLILPASEWTYWDPEAEKVHRVTREILRNHGKPIREVATKLNDLLKRKTVYSDGWVVDKPWITQLFDRAGVRQLFRVSPIETILSEAQMNLWHETKSDLIREQNLERHRASIDAFVIQETYVRPRMALQSLPGGKSGEGGRLLAERGQEST
jgi:hypothetical protein